MTALAANASDGSQVAPIDQKSEGFEEFCDRFVANMVVRAGHERFANGCMVLDYARETAPTYWEEASLKTLGPEGCVVADMRHWHGSWT